MIASFGDEATEALFHGEPCPRRIPAEIRHGAARKLDLLNGAHSLQDLRSPSGNRLEALRGSLVIRSSPGSGTTVVGRVPVGERS